MYTVATILVSVLQMEPLLLCEYTTKLNQFSDKRFIVRKNVLLCKVYVVKLCNFHLVAFRYAEC
jgi:hypothetical protein